MSNADIIFTTAQPQPQDLKTGWYVNVGGPLLKSET